MIVDEFSKLLKKYLGEPINKETVCKIESSAAEIMYENGFNDEYVKPDFSPVIPNVNLLIEISETNFELSYYEKAIDDFITVAICAV